MDIHTMMANAAADIRSMEMRTEALARELKAEKEDNERLRQENAKITAARMHAEADLIHYQNVFVASVCIEAGNICKEFFNSTHEKVRERAEGAIQRFVEEKVDKERVDNLVNDSEEIGYKPSNEINPVDDPEDFREFDKSISEAPSKSPEVQVTYFTTPEGDSLIKPPSGCSWREAKQFWLRNSTARRPASAEGVYAGFPLSSIRDDSPLLPKNQDQIPKFLTEPKEPPTTSLRGMLATVGL